MMCCSGAPNSPSAATRLSTAAAPNSSHRSFSPRSCSSWVSMVVLPMIDDARSIQLSRLFSRSLEAGDHLDLAANVRIELPEIFRRNPIFLVSLSTRIPDLVARQKAPRDVESRHVPRPGRGHVPVACDLAGIFLGQHRIEDRLLRETRREFAKVRQLDQCELGRPDRSVQRDSFGVTQVADLRNSQCSMITTAARD